MSELDQTEGTMPQSPSGPDPDCDTGPDANAGARPDEAIADKGEDAPAPAGTGAGRSDAPHSGIGAQDSGAINANLAGLAAGTVQLVG